MSLRWLAGFQPPAFNNRRIDMEKTYNLSMYYTVTYKKIVQVQATADQAMGRDVLNDPAYKIISESNCYEWVEAGDPDVYFHYDEVENVAALAGGVSTAELTMED